MTSPVDTTVKYFHSDMTGAPVMSGTAGSLIAVLDACLVNGFGLKTVDSLVVAGNVATMNISTGHSAEIGAVQLVEGATPAELNGEQKVTGTTATTITFATTGITDQTATGTITAKVAPAGWAKTFSGTNLAAYNSTDVTATGCLLRVDDTSTKTARVVGYESMSDVNTGTGPFPTTAQLSGGDWWSKSNAVNSTERTWMLVSDGRMFYFARAFYLPTLVAHELTVFGDFLPTKPGDPFGCLLSGQVTDVSTGVASTNNNYWHSNSAVATGFFVPRSYTGIGGAQQVTREMPVLSVGSTGWTSGAGSITYPNPADGGLYVVPSYLNENTVATLRGVSPGFYGCPQNVPAGAFATRDSVVGISGMPGKTLKAITCMNTATVCFIDITGPWR